MAAAYRDGASVLDLASQFGMSRSTVSQRLKSVGVLRSVRRLDDVAVNRAVRLYERGWSLQRLAGEFGLPRTQCARPSWLRACRFDLGRGDAQHADERVVLFASAQTVLPYEITDLLHDHRISTTTSCGSPGSVPAPWAAPSQGDR